MAIVNQALVDRYWPGQNAIGKRIQVAGGWYTVVGVAANGKYRRMAYDSAPLVLLPLMQRYDERGDSSCARRTATRMAIRYRPWNRRCTVSMPICRSYNVTTLKDEHADGQRV